MRRLFLTILMLFLPLQWSAAAVELCCVEEKAAAQQDLGQHDHEHRAQAGDDGRDGDTKAFGGDCPSCLGHSFHAVAHDLRTLSVAPEQGGASPYLAFVPEPAPQSLFRPPLFNLA